MTTRVCRDEYILVDNSMKIRGKLLCSFFVVILVFGAVVVYLLISGQNIDRLHVQRALAGKVLTDWQKLDYDTLLLRSDVDTFGQYSQSWSKSRQRFLESIHRLLENAGSTDSYGDASEALGNLTRLWALVAPHIDSLAEIYEDSANESMWSHLSDRSVDQVLYVLYDEKYGNNSTYAIQILRLDKELDNLRRATDSFTILLTEYSDDVKAQAEGAINRQQLVSLIAVLAAAAGTFGFVIIFTGRLSKRLLSVDNAMEYLAQHDLTTNVEIRAKDETGRLAHHINTVSESFKDIIGDIQNSIYQSAELRSEIARSSTDSEQVMNRVSGSICDMEKLLKKLDDEIRTVIGSAESIDSSLVRQSESLERQSAAVDESTAAIEEMTASVKSVSDIATDRSRDVRDLVQITEKGSDLVEGTDAIISDIAGEIRSLLEIIDIIDGIASQTNLLSMNAAIESAHAGEAGRGFAVVADEIRKLAESVAKHSHTVSESLGEITSRIERARESSTGSLETFRAVRREVERVNHAFSEIDRAMGEMASGTTEIMAGTEEVRSITSDIVDGIRSVKQESDAIATVLSSVDGLSSTVLNGIGVIGDGSGKMVGTIGKLANAGNHSNEVMELLSRKISVFKT